MQDEGVPVRGCSGCNAYVEPQVALKALGTFWHPDCLKCEVCNTQLTVNSAQSSGNKPRCVWHANMLKAVAKVCKEMGARVLMHGDQDEEDQDTYKHFPAGKGAWKKYTFENLHEFVPNNVTTLHPQLTPYRNPQSFSLVKQEMERAPWEIGSTHMVLEQRRAVLSKQLESKWRIQMIHVPKNPSCSSSTILNLTSLIPQVIHLLPSTVNLEQDWARRTTLQTWCNSPPSFNR